MGNIRTFPQILFCFKFDSKIQVAQYKNCNWSVMCFIFRHWGFKHLIRDVLQLAKDMQKLISYLMVFGQNILRPHAWSESRERPPRSWCICTYRGQEKQKTFQSVEITSVETKQAKQILTRHIFKEWMSLMRINYSHAEESTSTENHTVEETKRVKVNCQTALTANRLNNIKFPKCFWRSKKSFYPCNLLLSHS